MNTRRLNRSSNKFSQDQLPSPPLHVKAGGEVDRRDHVAIVGGGIAGLSAAWYLQQAGTGYSILEASNRWGGKVYTETVDGFGEAPFILEMGADAFLTRKPWALELARELGLSERIHLVNTENSRTFVLRCGKPVPLPDGLQLLVPTRLLPVFRSPLFSTWGKFRVLFDLFIPPRRSEADETLANFIRRRLGAEMLDRVAAPMLAGVYNGDPEFLSMQATFPQFPILERQYGSLIRGQRAAQRQPTPTETPAFISFKTGAHELIDALVAQFVGDLHLNRSVIHIERLADDGYRLTTSDNVIEANALILATPAHVTAKLLREIAFETSNHLNAISYTGIGTAYLGFRREDVPHPLDGFGLVIPASERRQIDGVTFTSSKWNYRAPTDHVLLRIFFGGTRTRKTLQLDDNDLLSVIRAELQSIFGISVPPLFHRIYRWEEGYPQYNLGHLEHVTKAEAALPSGIFITGSAYHGVGVPDCVRQGREVAQTVFAWVEKVIEHKF
jgi:oxygen-dependent protoporphyrinogen oxidase